MIRLISTVLLLCATLSTARAATLSDVQVVPQSAALFNEVSVTANGGDIGVWGFAATSFFEGLPTHQFDTSITLNATTTQFSAVDQTLGALALEGQLLDAVNLDGVFLALFATNAGTLAADFGNLFRTALVFDVQQPDLLSASGFVGDATLIVEAVEEIAPVPLPAGLPLFLTALIGLGRLRKTA